MDNPTVYSKALTKPDPQNWHIINTESNKNCEEKYRFICHAPSLDEFRNRLKHEDVQMKPSYLTYSLLEKQPQVYLIVDSDPIPYGPSHSSALGKGKGRKDEGGCQGKNFSFSDLIPSSPRLDETELDET